MSSNEGWKLDPPPPAAQDSPGLKMEKQAGQVKYIRGNREQSVHHLLICCLFVDSFTQFIDAFLQ